jgi:hypothetical protein
MVVAVTCGIKGRTSFRLVEVRGRLEDKLAEYLVTVHGARTCLGLAALHEQARGQLPHLRTLARYHVRYAEQFSYFPNFRLEDLGLVQLHLFVAQPDPRWAQLPYAVESRWCTSNLVDPVLYLHCLVPAIHKDRLEEFLRLLPFPGDLLFVWSGSPWQHVRLGDANEFEQQFPIQILPSVIAGPLPRELVFAIPVLAETWNTRLSLHQVWQRIYTRLDGTIRHFLPTRRFCPVNGKRHVKAVLKALLHSGAFRQNVLRFPTECTLLLLTPDYDRSLPVALRSATKTADLFPTIGGGAFWRLGGSYDLFSARSSLCASTIFFVETNTPPPVRFCYEWLFDPQERQWAFSEDRIRAQMQVSA